MLKKFEPGLETEFLRFSQYEVLTRADRRQPCHTLPWQRQELL